MNFKDYIRGQRHGKEANQLERDAMHDPFLQDAIDGFDTVQANHAFVIEKLEKQLPAAKKRADKRLWAWAAAAVLALLVGIPLLMRQIPTSEVQTASREVTESSQEITAFAPEKDSVLTAESHTAETPPPSQETVKSEDDNAALPEKTSEKETVKISDNKYIHTQEHTDVLAQTKIDTSVRDQLQDRAAGVSNQNKNIRIRGTSALSSPKYRQVRGRLVDQSGEPIIGGSVMLKNSTAGTVTDAEGNFSFTLPTDSDGVLLATYVGMESKEFPIRENIGNIVMKDDLQTLDEVVVVGLGTQRKTVMVGSVSAAKEKTLSFGEKEFQNYFIKNYDKAICAGENIAFSVEFYIDAQGRPGSIQIKESNCPRLEVEIKRLLLGSPLWTERNRKVKTEIKFMGIPVMN